MYFNAITYILSCIGVQALTLPHTLLNLQREWCWTAWAWASGGHAAVTRAHARFGHRVLGVLTGSLPYARFVTRAELDRVGLGHLVGMPLLRAFMHAQGFRV